MKKIIITGANGNLGKAVIKKITENGSYVIALVENGAMKNDIEMYANLQVEAANLMDIKETAEVISKCIEVNHKIDAAILLVGGFAMGNIYNTTVTDIAQQVNLNFNTAYNEVQPIFQHMMKNENGRIVLIGARPALNVSAGKDALAYTLSKSLLFKLAECLNDEAKEKNVAVTVVVPSIIDTAPNRSAMPDADFGRWVKPESNAEVIDFVIGDSGSIIREGILKVYNNA